jgi:uncharacterized peroxidase-related enzyme
MPASFLEEPAMTPAVRTLYDEDLAEDGYVMNVSRLDAYQPETMRHLLALIDEAFEPTGFGLRQRAILVLATASALGDSYCSLVWGGRLAQVADAGLAAAVLTGSDAGLTSQEAAMASWARKVVEDPNATSGPDVQRLRDEGLTDAQIFAVTLFVSLRLARATVNDALGARPDTDLVASLPPEVVAAVTYGREPNH